MRRGGDPWQVNLACAPLPFEVPHLLRIGVPFVAPLLIHQATLLPRFFEWHGLDVGARFLRGDLGRGHGSRAPPRDVWWRQAPDAYFFMQQVLLRRSSWQTLNSDHGPNRGGIPSSI